MTQTIDVVLWNAFVEINHCRRAVRDFDGRPIPDEILKEILAEAILAPSSINLQPYQFHWVKDADTTARVVEACNRQRAAASAATIIVVVASSDIAGKTAVSQLAYINETSELSEGTKEYSLRQIQKAKRVLSIGSWPVWTPILNLIALLRPSLSLLPIGHMGSRGWAARNANFAAQTLLLSASAKGIDTCPMEGFSAGKIIDALGLPRGSVVPVIVALGYRQDDALIEPQWRRSFDEVVVVH